MKKETAQFIQQLYRNYRTIKNKKAKDQMIIQILAFIEGYTSAISDIK